MKKKEIKKIEDKLSDVEISDSVLDLARAELSESNNIRKPATRRFNLKIVLSCAASLALCFAIILPISLSAFDKKDNGFNTDFSGDSSHSPSEPPADADSPSDAAPYYELKFLDKEQVYPDAEYNDPSSGDAEAPPATDDDSEIKYLSHIKYSSGGMEIISEETYSVYETECTVYTLYNTDFEVDILMRFNNLAAEYSVGSVKIKYCVNSDGYSGDAYLNNKRYCFILKSKNQDVFEEFCRYLFN